MRDARARWTCALALFYAMLGAVAPVSAQEIAPFKDQLFSYPNILERRDAGRHRVIDYRIERDLYRRDEEPERRVQPNYVDLAPRRVQKELALKLPSGPLRYYAVGDPEKAQFIVVFLHGQGGNRMLGVNDYSFGGNFNRLKNIATRNRGLYLSPDLQNFSATDGDALTALIEHYRGVSPRAKTVLACGSMGGTVCWQMSKDPRAAALIDGMVMLGSVWADDFQTHPTFKKRVPLYIAHGGDDKVFPISAMDGFYKQIRKAAPDYPVNFVQFETGSHGTPIRMIDWREALNAVLSGR